MESTNKFAVQLKDNLNTCIDVLDELFNCQKKMYKSVVGRDWSFVEEETNNLGIITEKYNELEKKREQILSKALKINKYSHVGTASFYTFTNNLNPKEKEELNSLYRELRRLLILSKTENDILNAYIISAKKIVSEVLEEIIPNKKNKIYTKNGSLAEHNSESLVLNRSF